MLNNHPIFNSLRKKLGVRYRVYFTNLRELGEWLAARSYTPVAEKYWDSPTYMEWTKGDPGDGKLLKIAKTLFDKSNKLKVMTPEEWNDGNILLGDYPVPESISEKDDIPF